MRYHETSEHSGELLRLILPRIARHGGTYYPTSYAVWYEYLAGINPRLADALNARLNDPRPVSNDETVRLFARYIAARDVEAAEKLHAEFNALLLQLGTLASSAGADAADFSRALQEASAQLDAPLDSGALRELIQVLARRTTAVQSSTDEMRHQLESSAQQITALKDQLDKVQGEALTDSLTNLRNRRGFERAAESLLGSRPNGLQGSSLIMADIDHFKRINDSYGHLVGDQVIRSVAGVLHSNIKGRDVAARFGGEEFAILLPDTDLDAAALVAEQIRLAVGRGRLKRTGSNEYIDKVTISLGTACGYAGESVDALIHRADVALYQAKQSGRNRVETVAAAA